MINSNYELLFELWSRMKPHIPPKERLEAADTLMVVFDEFNLVEEDILNEDLDKELRAAARSLLCEPEDDIEEENDNDSGW